MKLTDNQRDLFVLTEPLACVMHAYERLPETMAIRTACIFGGGPIGSLHSIEIKRRFPDVKVYFVEPNTSRRSIVKKVFPGQKISSEIPQNSYDLVVVACSDPQANLDAISITKPLGVTLLFSGINHKTLNEVPSVEGINLEKVHRHEKIEVLSNGTRLIGSSGYSKKDIQRAVYRLWDDPKTYQVIQTGRVDDLSSHFVISKDGSRRATSQASICELLDSNGSYYEHLKVVCRVQDNQVIKVVPSAKSDGKFQAKLMNNNILNNPIKNGFTRLKMDRVAICNTDRRVLNGTKAATISEKLILGHEGTGFISNEKGHYTEDLLLILPHFYDNSDPLLALGVPYLSTNLKHLGIHINGCFATYIDVPQSCTFNISDCLRKRAKQVEQQVIFA